MSIVLALFRNFHFFVSGSIEARSSLILLADSEL